MLFYVSSVSQTPRTVKLLNCVFIANHCKAIDPKRTSPVLSLSIT
jgi:hypothetical protein